MLILTPSCRLLSYALVHALLNTLCAVNSICCNSGVRRASTLEGRVRRHQSRLLTLYISVTLASCSERRENNSALISGTPGLLVEMHSRLGSACIISGPISREVMLDYCESKQPAAAVCPSVSFWNNTFWTRRSARLCIQARRVIF